jgi:hypothetical protein
MTEQYVEGFMAKCAQAGVDPEQLVKQARGGAIRKLLRAGILTGAKKDSIPKSIAGRWKSPREGKMTPLPPKKPKKSPKDEGGPEDGTE